VTDPLRIEKLQRTHAVEEFTCGQPALGPGDLGPLFEVTRQDLASQAGLAWLPIGFWDGILIEHYQGGHSLP
jgi:hypothetical protein